MTCEKVQRTVINLTLYKVNDYISNKFYGSIHEMKDEIEHIFQTINITTFNYFYILVKTFIILFTYTKPKIIPYTLYS
jgi:hypothetical protein